MKKWLTDWAKSLFPHEKKVRYILLGFTALLLIAMATKCRADDITFEVGTQYLRGPAAAVLVSTRWDGPKDASWEAGLILVGQNPDDGGVMGTQVMYVDGFGKFDIGLGAAYFNRQSMLLGSNMNFSLLVGYRFTDRWGVNIRHWSNASTTKNNTGMDVVTLSYKF